MWVKWLGHAAFLITTDSGLKIITDPYSCGGGIDYGPIEESADIVTISHKHGDHDNVRAVKGSPDVLDKAGAWNVRGIDIKAVPSYHDTAEGSQRGDNLIFTFLVDDMRLCHLGDLGHPVSKGQVSEIGPVDILLIPVGGVYTIDAKVATRVTEELSPKVVIPMHFRTPGCTYPISGVDDFLKGRKNVRRFNKSETQFQKDLLPVETETVVLKHAL